jgi:hypothetical protein
MNRLLLKQTGLRQIEGCVYCKIKLFKKIRIKTNVFLPYLELLFYILNDRLTIKANKGSADQFWMNWMGTNNLSKERAN